MSGVGTNHCTCPMYLPGVSISTSYVWRAYMPGLFSSFTARSESGGMHGVYGNFGWNVYLQTVKYVGLARTVCIHRI